METTLFIVSGTVFYLLIGYVWAMLFIHKMTDGYWVHKGTFHTNRYKMGAGTAIGTTLFWPFHMIACAIMIGVALIALLFDADFWKKVYRL